MKKIGLVTVLYNSPAVLPDFFSSLAVQDYSEYCLYVIDNSSSSESLELAKKLSSELSINIKLIDNEGSNVGVAAGNNQGAREAYNDGCDFILFLNNDLLFENPRILKTLLMQADTQRMDMVSPTILNYPEKKVWYCGGYFDEWKSLAPHDFIDTVYDVANFPPVHQHDYAPTCFLMISRHLWETVGEMDEKYFAYFDDTDFLYRAHKAGFVVNVISDLVIYHKVGSSTGGDLSYFGMYHLTRNRVFFIRKNLNGIKKTYSLCYLFLTRFYMIMFTSNKQKKAIRKGLIDGLKMR
ncbi:glycosyltransferase family 2 protein [Buttiauxella agrestis]